MATFLSLDTVETIYTAFNNKATKIVGTPNIDTLRALRNQLKSNAANLQSNVGGGNHGDLGLILSNAAYAIVAPTTPYVRSVNPGPLPIFPNGGGTAAQIAAIERVHCVEFFEFNRYKNVEAALKRFLLHSIDDIYVHALYQLHIGYANCTTRELLDHLFASYGRVHPDDLVANTKTMQKPWDPPTRHSKFWRNKSMTAPILRMPLDSPTPQRKSLHKRTPLYFLLATGSRRNPTTG
jgi:hypothetical protein